MRCPKCNRVLPGSTERCRCGYDFPTGTMMAPQEQQDDSTQSGIHATQEGREHYPFVLVCRECYATLRWGQPKCRLCGTKVYHGIPHSIDRFIVLVINLGIALILYWTITAIFSPVLSGILNLHTPKAALLVIAFFLISMRGAFLLVGKLVPNFSIHPLLAHVKLDLRDHIKNIDSCKKVPYFDLEIEKKYWESYFGDNLPLSRLLTSYLTKDLDPFYEVALLTYLPLDLKMKQRLLVLSHNENPMVKEKALELMSRTKNDPSEEIVKYKCLDCGQASWTTKSKGCKKCGSKNLQNGVASEKAVPTIPDNAMPAFSDKATIQQDAMSDNKGQASGVLRDGKLMGICSKCGTRVMPTSKGLCPACRTPFVEAE